MESLGLRGCRSHLLAPPVCGVWWPRTCPPALMLSGSLWPLGRAHPRSENCLDAAHALWPPVHSHPSCSLRMMWGQSLRRSPRDPQRPAQFLAHRRFWWICTEGIRLRDLSKSYQRKQGGVYNKKPALTWWGWDSRGDPSSGWETSGPRLVLVPTEGLLSPSKAPDWLSQAHQGHRPLGLKVTD